MGLSKLSLTNAQNNKLQPVLIMSAVYTYLVCTFHFLTSVCNLNTKEHKSKSAAITQTGNRVQDLAGVRNETKSSESKFGKAQVSIC